MSGPKDFGEQVMVDNFTRRQSRWHLHVTLWGRPFGVLCPPHKGVEMRGRRFGPLDVTWFRFYPVIWP